MTCSLAAHFSVACWAVALAELVDDAPMEGLVESPRIVSVWLAVILLLVAANSISTAVGAQMCPAAVSSTLCTSTQMVCGYIADIVITKTLPNALTIVGASLMLLAVIVMAVAPSGNS